MEQIILVIHVLLGFSLIGLVLIQHGKGAEAGASFGAGASATVFGSRGSGSFLTRMTTTLALCFAITSLSLAYLATHRGQENQLDQLIEQVDQRQSAGGSPAAVADDDLPVIPEDN